MCCERSNAIVKPSKQLGRDQPAEVMAYRVGGGGRGGRGADGWTGASGQGQRGPLDVWFISLWLIRVALRPSDCDTGFGVTNS